MMPLDLPPTFDLVGRFGLEMRSFRSMCCILLVSLLAAVGPACRSPDGVVSLLRATSIPVGDGIMGPFYARVRECGRSPTSWAPAFGDASLPSLKGRPGKSCQALCASLRLRGGSGTSLQEDASSQVTSRGRAILGWASMAAHGTAAWCMLQ